MYEQSIGYRYHCGPNDGGIKRGDSAETGDDKAGPNGGAGRGGSGTGTGDGSSLGESTGSVPGTEEEDLDGFEILDADDPALGLGKGEEG